MKLELSLAERFECLPMKNVFLRNLFLNHVPFLETASFAVYGKPFAFPRVCGVVRASVYFRERFFQNTRQMHDRGNFHLRESLHYMSYEKRKTRLFRKAINFHICQSLTNVLGIN